MASTLQDRVARAQKKLGKERANFDWDRSTDPVLQKDIAAVETYLRDQSIPVRNHASLISHIVTAEWGHSIDAIHAGNSNMARSEYLRFVTHTFLYLDLHRNQMTYGHKPKWVISHGKLAEIALMLHSIGWHEEALGLVRDYWTHYAKTTSRPIDAPNPPFPGEVLAWFTSYFVLGSRDLIAPYGFEEPDAPDTPMSHLLARWLDQDAASVVNLFTAFGEHNAAIMLQSANRRPSDYHSDLMLMVPYDTMAIQARRAARGFDPIPATDLRDTGIVKLEGDQPLIADDLVWSAYRMACEGLELPVYEPRQVVEATLSRADLSLQV